MNIYALYNLTTKFAKDVAEEYSDDEQILIENGIIPIQGISGSSWLGEGEHSVVYKVSYNGKQMVAKITRDSIDVKNIKTLYDLGQYIGDLKKHIPFVYGVKTYDDGMSSPLYIVLVEELKPINQKLKDMITGESPEQIAAVFLDQNIVISIIDKIINLVHLKKYISDSLINIIINELSDLLSNLMKPLSDIKFINKIIKSNKIPDLSNSIGDLFIKGMKKLIYDKVGKNTFQEILNEHEFDNQILKQIRDILYNFIYDLLKKQIKFPTSHEKYNYDTDQYGFSMYEHLPETKSLMHLLKTLQQYGINWQDLQYFNLMQRPSTGDIVISDPGNFDLI